MTPFSMFFIDFVIKSLFVFHYIFFYEFKYKYGTMLASQIVHKLVTLLHVTK